MANYETVIDLMNDRERLKQERDALVKALQQIAGLGEDDDDPEYEIARRALAVVSATGESK